MPSAFKKTVLKISQLTSRPPFFRQSLPVLVRILRYNSRLKLSGSCNKNTFLLKLLRLVWFVCLVFFLIAPPKFTAPTKKMARNLIAVPVGNSVKLDCSATGYPRPTVRWYKDGALFQVGKGGSRIYLKKFTTVLVMKDVVPYDTGKYTCNVSNAYGWINHSYSVNVRGRIDFYVASVRQDITFYYIDKTALLENTLLVKFIPNYTRNPSGVFSIFSLVKN